MCTLAVALGTDRRWPLVVAANRDERLARAAEGWAVRRPPAGPRYVAPRDLVAGGTWIGLSAAGVLAAVTNVHTGAPPDPSRRSRGALVGLALAHPGAAAAGAALAGLDPAAWNPFHLLLADAAGAVLWRWDGRAAALAPLAPGLHVITEEAAEDRGPRGELVRARWPLDLDPARLRQVLTQHGPGRDATCIHGDPLYGTRSSVLLRLAGSLGASELLVADGRPCQAPFEDAGDLLRALAVPASP